MASRRKVIGESTVIQTDSTGYRSSDDEAVIDERCDEVDTSWLLCPKRIDPSHAGEPAEVHISGTQFGAVLER